MNTKRFSGAAGVAVLALVGALVVSAAPTHGSPPATLQARVLAASSSSPVATTRASTATAASPAKATATKAPTAPKPAPVKVAAPAVATPTDTPIPPPTPTATPAPTWHTIGSYTGSAPQTFPSFTTANPWRFVWTCTPDPATIHSFSFSFSADGTQFAAFGDQCISQNPTSGTIGTCQPGGQVGFPCDASHTYTVSSYQSGPDPMCVWTATIEVYY